MHVSQIANRHVKNPNEVLEMGQEVKVKVLEVHVAEKRISLSIKEALEENNVTEDYSQYEPNADSATFQLSDIIGEQLKKLKNKEVQVVRAKRKLDHIEYALSTGQSRTHGFHDIDFVHQSLPNSNYDTITCEKKSANFH